MLLGQFLCHNHNVNQGHSTSHLHQGRAASSDPYFVVWRCIRGRNPSNTFSTIQGSTINNARYSEMLIGRLKPEIWSKHWGQLSKGIVLLHDNAHPHTAASTVETLQKLNFEVLAHPPYSPDLAPSEYHLFGPLKEALRGCRFTSDQELKEMVHAWLTARPKTFFSEGIKKLVQQWKKCIEKQGDCVEKWCYFKLSIFIEIKFVSLVWIIIDSPTYISLEILFKVAQQRKLMHFTWMNFWHIVFYSHKILGWSCPGRQHERHM